MDLKKDLAKIMDNLNYAFVSEGDFQFVLAKKIQENFGEKSVIVEFPIGYKSLDLAVIDNDNKEISFIELKYYTNEDTVLRNTIRHTFKSTGTNMVKFMEDIIKIESIKEKIRKLNLQNKINYCILLTNNNSIKIDQKIKNIDKFCEWKNCNKIKTQSNKTNFRYLLVEIKENVK